MRVWLYARLSNDDDREMNSLLNQQEICRAYADKHGHIVVVSSFDDNVSGMKFSRRGLDELTAAVDAPLSMKISLLNGISRVPAVSQSGLLSVVMYSFCPSG